MKGKRLLLIVAVAFFLAIGWLMSIKAASGEKERKEQAAIIAQADEFLQKELYVRAIPLYRSAMKYNTDRLEEVEERLLICYWNFGETDSYIALVKKRAKNGTASDEEYIRAADIYMDSLKTADALELIKTGIEKNDSQVLKDYYEKNRYGYTLYTTKWKIIRPCETQTLMPAFDGQHWGYINDRGREELEFKYDSAVAFNKAGYAVVSMDGKYYTITSAAAKYGVDENPVTDVLAVTGNYIFAQKDGKYSFYDYDFNLKATEEYLYEAMSTISNGVLAAKKNGKWGIITSGGTIVVDYILEDVAINSLGAAYSNNGAMVKMEGKWYLIDSSGKKICETGFAEAKAPESNGYIAVGDGNGKWGFIDWAGNQVIPYQYTDAYSFSNHVAAVLNVNDWSYISESNKKVIEEILEEAQPFHNGLAIVRFVEKAALIKLSYVEE